MKKISKKNLDAVKKLIDMYESINQENIDSIRNDCPVYMVSSITYRSILFQLTGFGNKAYCIVCESTRYGDSATDCSKCIHSIQRDILNACIFHETYDAIDKSKTDKEFLSNIKKRAEYLRSILRDYNKRMKDESK